MPAPARASGRHACGAATVAGGGRGARSSNPRGARAPPVRPRPAEPAGRARGSAAAGARCAPGERRDHRQQQRRRRRPAPDGQRASARRAAARCARGPAPRRRRSSPAGASIGTLARGVVHGGQVGQVRARRPRTRAGARPRARVAAASAARRRGRPTSCSDGRMRAHRRRLPPAGRRARDTARAARAQPLARAGQSAHDRAHVDRERLGDLPVGQLLEHAQREDRPLLRRAAARARARRTCSGLAVQHALERAGRRGRASRRGPRASGSSRAGRRADVVDGEVGRDPADPGPERPGQVERVEGLVGTDEGLLGDVVRHLVAAHDAQGRAVHAPLVALDDLLERKEVPPPGLGQEVGLARIDRLVRGRRGRARSRGRGTRRASASAAVLRQGYPPAAARIPGLGDGSGRRPAGPPRGSLLQDLDDDAAVLGAVVPGLVVLPPASPRRRR